MAQIKKVLPSVEATLPPDVQVHIALDRSQSVTAAVGDTERSLFMAVLLVIGVVFVFLQSPRSTLIPAVVVPLSILGTFGPMYLLGYSIDNLSLMALTIATGFVVDDAVVVLENIVRHLESGMDPRGGIARQRRGRLHGDFDEPVADRGVQPILLMPGTVGLLFHEFAVTLSIAILFSLLISLTVTPIMCAYLLGRGEALHSKARWAIWANAQFERFKSAYSRSLTAVLDHALLVGLTLIGLIVLNVFLVQAGALDVLPGAGQRTAAGADHRRPEHFLPGDGEEARQLQNIVAEGSRHRFGDRLRRRPRAQYRQRVHRTQALGARQLSADQVVAAPASQTQASVRRAAVPAGGAGSAHRRPAVGRRIPVHPDQRGYGRPVHVDAQARDRARQDTAVKSMDVNSDLQQNGLQTYVTINRETAARYGFAPNQIDSVLYDAFGQRTVSTIFNPFNQYFVVMEVAPEILAVPADARPDTLQRGRGQCQRHPADPGAGQHGQPGAHVRRGFGGGGRGVQHQCAECQRRGQCPDQQHRQ